MAGNVAHELFAEYASLVVRGERPRASDFLRRAGGDADQLAAMIDSYLRAAPRPIATAEDSALLASLLGAEPPLLELRVRQGLKRGTVVDALLEALGLAAKSRGRLADAYHELETGQLDPRGVDRRVWDALSSVLGPDVRSLARWRPAPVEAAVAYRLAEATVNADYVPAQAPAEEDEVDRLFRSGS